MLWLSSTQVSDLAPLQGLSGLQRLTLSGTPLLSSEPALQEIYESEENGAELVRKILEWQQGWEILIESGLDAGALIEARKIPRFLTEGIVRIGRDRSWSDIVLQDTGVSRQHAELVARGSKLSVRDMRTANGTRIDGQILSNNIEVECTDPCSLQLASTTIKISRTRSGADKAPPTQSELTVKDLPEQIEELEVGEQDGRMEVRPGAISPDEDGDPLRRKLHERLRRNAGLLQQAAGNRYYRLAAKASRLMEVLDCAFEDLDPVDVWLELEELRVDSERDNARREDPYEEELLSALALTVDVGGGLVIGTRDVETLETRRDKMRETATVDSDAAASEVARQIIADPTPWGERLRAYLGIMQGAEPDESGRFQAINYALVRNALIGAGKWILAAGAAGVVGGSSYAAVEWLMAHPEAVTRFAESMTVGAGDWLLRLLERARQIFYTAEGGVPIPPVKPPFG